MAGSSYTLSGQRKVTDAEAREHQSTLYAKRITDIPGDIQVLVDAAARSDNQPVYVGFGAKGLASSADGWLIWKLTYDSNNDFSTKKSAFGVYDNRAALTYE